MPLSKKLWLAVLVIMIMALSGSLIVSLSSARNYLSDQLYLKNLDNANSLALSMSQVDKDPVTIEVLLAAQFDTGHYQYIRLRGPNDEDLFSRAQDSVNHRSPEWFRNLVSLDSEPGLALVQDGWNQYGTLQVKSHSGIAYQTLWKETVSLLGWFLLAGIFTGLVGTRLLRRILKPLDQIVEQAHAIGERRFISTPEPKTLEFQKVVRSMNNLSQRVREMLNAESARVESLRHASQIDKATGLYRREHFLNLFTSRLQQNDEESVGMLVIFRIENMIELNREMGWQKTDEMLAKIGEYFSNLLVLHGHWAVGRLGGSDFVVLVPGTHGDNEFYAMMSTEIRDLMDFAGFEMAILRSGATHFVGNESAGMVLSRADDALAQSEESDSNLLVIEPVIHDNGLPNNQSDWSNVLKIALTPDNTQLAEYPVIDVNGNLIHFESPIKAFINDEWRNAGQFIQWVGRLGRMELLDNLVLNSAIEKIRNHSRHISINLSSEALVSAEFLQTLTERLELKDFDSSKLHFDIPEYHALKFKSQFKHFSQSIRPYQCRISLKHVGPQFARIGDIHDVGLQYLKIDASITSAIDFNQGNQAYLRGVCVIAHSIGVKTIAEGVSTKEEKDCLVQLGIDGMTGPYIKL